MLVIARDLGIKVDRDSAYKGEDGKYYSSEQAWKKEKLKKKVKRGLKEDDEHQKQMRKKCIDKMFEFMHYDSGARMPKPFFGRLGIWANNWGYNYDVIYESMVFVSNTVDYVSRTKDFDSEMSKMFYIMGIIQNALNDGKKIFDARQKAIAEAQNVTKEETEVDTEVGVSNRVGKIINLFGDGGDDDWM